MGENKAYFLFWEDLFFPFFSLTKKPKTKEQSQRIFFVFLLFSCHGENKAIGRGGCPFLSLLAFFFPCLLFFYKNQNKEFSVFDYVSEERKKKLVRTQLFRGGCG